MNVINKKIQPQWFEAILSGKKKYEFRLNDFKINEGDLLVLSKINPETNELTGRKLEKTVTWVTKFKMDELYWPEEEIKDKGIQIISFE